MTEGTRADELRVDGKSVRVRSVAGDVAWSFGADDPIAAAACEARGAVRVFDAGARSWEFDAETGSLVGRTSLALERLSYSAAFDRTGALVATSASREEARVYELASGRAVATMSARGVDVSGSTRSPYLWRLELAGFSGDAAHVLGAATETLGPNRFIVIQWDARRGSVALVRRSACAPVWNAAGDAFYLLDEARKRISCVTQQGNTRWEAPLALAGEAWLALSGDGETVLARGRVPVPPRKPGDPWRRDAPAHRFAAFDARDGRFLWARDASAGVAFAPVPESALVLTGDPRAALDAVSGAPREGDVEAHKALVRGFGRRALAWSRAWGALFVAQRGRVRRYDSAPWRERPFAGLALGELTRVAVSPSGARFATASRPRDVRVWKTSGAGTEWELEGLTRRHAIDAVEFATDERSVMAVSGDRASFWSVATGMGTQRLHFNATMAGVRDGTGVGLSSVRTARLADDARSLLLVGTADRAIRGFELVCFDLSTQRVRWRAGLPRALAAFPLGLAAREGQVWLATDSWNGASSRAWSLEDGAELAAPTPLRAPNGAADRVLVPFEPTGAWGAYGVYLTALRAGAGAVFACPFEGLSVRPPVAVCADGRWVLTGSDAGDALVWRARAGTSETPLRAECAARVRLSEAHDALGCGAFDARGSTLVLGTKRGRVVCCSLDPGAE